MAGMTDSIDLEKKRAAIVLAEERDYPRAAERLHVTPAALRKQIAALESQLWFSVFRPRQKRVELTEEGRFLIRIFREAIHGTLLKRRQE